MLQNTQVLAQEMDLAVRRPNEGHFEVDRNGVPLLYCVVAAKSVSHIFTHENTEGYSIHYGCSYTQISRCAGCLRDRGAHCLSR